MTHRKHFPIVGEIIGQYTVLSDSIVKSNDGKIKFHVRCSCGKEHFIRAVYLRKRENPMCESCAKKIAYNKFHKERFDVSRNKYVGCISGTYFSHIRQSARHRGIDFILTKEYIWSLFIKQKEKCALSGVQIVLTVERKKSDPNFEIITASLDRINSNEGYAKGNVQWVHKTVNKMKNNLPQADFIEWCKLIQNNLQVELGK